MPDTFLESPRFPGCPAFGFTSDPEYRVVITRRASGVELRNRGVELSADAAHGHRGAARKTRSRSCSSSSTSVGGSAVGFRVKDYTDLQVAARSRTSRSATDQPLVETDVAGIYQLTKRYQFGTRHARPPDL